MRALRQLGLRILRGMSSTETEVLDENHINSVDAVNKEDDCISLLSSLPPSTRTSLWIQEKALESECPADSVNVNSSELDWGEFINMLCETGEELVERPGLNASIQAEIAEFYRLIGTPPTPEDRILEEDEEPFKCANLDDFWTTCNFGGLQVGEELKSKDPTGTDRVNCMGRPPPKPKRNHNNRYAAVQENPFRRPLPKVVHNMMEWYIRSSVRDLIRQISHSSDADIHFLVDSMLDLPIEDNHKEWCFRHLTSQIYGKLMKSLVVTVGQQVAFFNAVYRKQKFNRTASSLISDLQYKIGLMFKNISDGEDQLLMNDATLDIEAKTNEQSFLLKIVKFTKFLARIFAKGILTKHFMIENLLQASECSDIKSFVLSLSVITQISKTLDDTLLQAYEYEYVPLHEQNVDVRAVFQIYARLKSSNEILERHLPPSVVHFANGILFGVTGRIHLQWKQLPLLVEEIDIPRNIICQDENGDSTTAQFTDYLRFNNQTDNQRGQCSNGWEARRKCYRIAPIPTFMTVTESLLKYEIINEFNCWIIKKYYELRSSEARTPL